MSVTAKIHRRNNQGAIMCNNQGTIMCNKRVFIFGTPSTPQSCLCFYAAELLRWQSQVSTDSISYFCVILLAMQAAFIVLAHAIKAIGKHFKNNSVTHNSVSKTTQKCILL